MSEKTFKTARRFPPGLSGDDGSGSYRRDDPVRSRHPRHVRYAGCTSALTGDVDYADLAERVVQGITVEQESET
jgi:hypothetical protein